MHLPVPGGHDHGLPSNTYIHCHYCEPPERGGHTSDCDLLDLLRFLVDPLLAPDFLSGTHEFFEFLDLLREEHKSVRAEGESHLPLGL